MLAQQAEGPEFYAIYTHTNKVIFTTNKVINKTIPLSNKLRLLHFKNETKHYRTDDLQNNHINPNQVVKPPKKRKGNKQSPFLFSVVKWNRAEADPRTGEGCLEKTPPAQFSGELQHWLCPFLKREDETPEHTVKINPLEICV